jgi:proteasome lid subunit RPN8/RPN11
MSHFKPKSRSNLALLWRERPRGNSNLIPFASVDNSFEAYIHYDVLHLTLEASKNASPHEIIGLLAGRACQDAYSSYTIIMAAEVARINEIEATPNEVYISSGGYAELRNRLEINQPVLEILGWFHSHLSSPPIPSDEDLIEQSTWTDHNNIALVVSLISESESFGVFQGPEAIPLFCQIAPLAL